MAFDMSKGMFPMMMGASILSANRPRHYTQGPPSIMGDLGKMMLQYQQMQQQAARQKAQQEYQQAQLEISRSAEARAQAKHEQTMAAATRRQNALMDVGMPASGMGPPESDLAMEGRLKLLSSDVPVNEVNAIYPKATAPQKLSDFETAFNEAKKGDPSLTRLEFKRKWSAAGWKPESSSSNPTTQLGVWLQQNPDKTVEDYWKAKAKSGSNEHRPIVYVATGGPHKNRRFRGSFHERGDGSGVWTVNVDGKKMLAHEAENLLGSPLQSNLSEIRAHAGKSLRLSGERLSQRMYKLHGGDAVVKANIAKATVEGLDEEVANDIISQTEADLRLASSYLGGVINANVNLNNAGDVRDAMSGVAQQMYEAVARLIRGPEFATDSDRDSVYNAIMSHHRRMRRFGKGIEEKASETIESALGEETRGNGLPNIENMTPEQIDAELKAIDEKLNLNR